MTDYADQRAHDVAWLTAAEREAYDRGDSPDQMRLNRLYSMSPAELRRALAYLSGWQPETFDTVIKEVTSS